MVQTLAQVQAMAAARRNEERGFAEVLTLAGSSEAVAEFFEIAISGILFARGVYKHQDFEKVEKYDLPVFLSRDPGVKKYIAAVKAQLFEWLKFGTVKKVILALAPVSSPDDHFERWCFDIRLDVDAAAGLGAALTDAEVQERQGSIQKMIRSIANAGYILPYLTEPSTFDLVVYTDKDAQVPEAWASTDPKYVEGSQQALYVGSFDTRLHKVSGIVNFRYEGGAQTTASSGGA